MNLRYSSCAAAMPMASSMADAAPAQEQQGESKDLNAVLAWGCATELIGVAHAASDGTVGYANFVRHLGVEPFIEDGSVACDGTTLDNLGGIYEFARHDIEFDILNMLQSKERDVTYYYQSQLRREPTGVDDLHFRPVEPRQARVNFRTRF